MTQFAHCVFYPCWIELVHFEEHRHKWNAGLLKLVFRNVLEELLEDIGAKACIAKIDTQNYLVYLAADSRSLGMEKWQQTAERFTAFFNGRMDFRIAVYLDEPELDSYRPERIAAISSSRFANHGKRPGVYRETPGCVCKGGVSGKPSPMRVQSVSAGQKIISNPISAGVFQGRRWQNICI